jgi:RHS repeat-associated protein
VGSTRLITDETGVVIGSNTYDDYGKLTQHTGTGQSNMGYTGNWTDTATNLVYLRARDYDPTTAQFMTVDPALDQTHQPYGYVANDPLLTTDPQGLWSLGSIATSIGSAAAYVPNAWLSGAQTFVKDPNAALYDVASGPIGSSLVGLGDGASFGITHFITNNLLGLSSVDCQLQQSAFYTPFRVAGEVISTIATGGAGAVRSVGAAVIERVAAREAAEVGARAAVKETSDWPKLSGILRDAVKGKGNFGLGSGTTEQAAAAGKAWVGKGATLASDGKTLVSENGLRQFRPPSFKPNLGKTQANFEERNVPKGQWQSNGHLDIMDAQ